LPATCNHRTRKRGPSDKTVARLNTEP
jgi:hypothetical protein